MDDGRLQPESKIMTSSIRLKTSLECFTRKEGMRWLAACPVLDVHTQGRTEPEARRLIQEAVTLWFQSCIERNTLQEALQECGFTLVQEPASDS